MNVGRRRVRPEKTGVRAPLGDLEQSVMRYIWACAGAGCLGSEVQQELERDRPIAITTVLTTLDRLQEKGILRREREGKAYRYWAVITEEQLQQRIVGGVLDDLIARFPTAVAAYFAQQEKPARDAEPEGRLAALAERVEAARAAEQQRQSEQ